MAQSLTQGFYVAGWPSLHVPVDHLPAGRIAVMRERYAYVDELGEVHQSDACMPCDGLSIPRPFWRVAGPPFRHKYLQLAPPHDHYCYLAQSLPPGPARDEVRLRGDRALLSAARYVDPGARMAGRILYYAVRAGALYTGRKKQIPDYQADPEAFWETLGIADLMRDYLASL